MQMNTPIPNNKTFIYGASYLGLALAQLFEQQNTQYEFIDAYAPRDRVEGKYMYRPDEIKAEDKAHATVYIAVLLPPVKSGVDEALFEQLSQMGYAHLVSPYQTMSEFPETLSIISHDGLLWRNPHDENFVNQQGFESVLSFFNDERSKTLLTNIANFRQSFAVKDYIKPDYCEEYFPPEIDLCTGLDDLHILDCGAFDGDTIKQFFAAFKDRIKSYAAFEPELDNYHALTATANKIKNDFPQANINCFPMGVGNTNNVLRFASGDGAASHISDEGETEIFVVKLDDTHTNSTVNLIKIDVEGADLDVITGATELIKQQRPNIAVSCYHQPGHIWQIPQLIKAINPDYQLFLRQHGHYGFELTLYCIDKSRFNHAN